MLLAVAIVPIINKGKQEDVTSEDIVAGTITTESRKEDHNTQEISSAEEKVTENEGYNFDELQKNIPEYSGTAFCELTGNIPVFLEEDKKKKDPFEMYSELDSLGRCGVAYANICKELMPDQERGPIGQIKPSGWHTVKYNDIIEGNYLYNRCHLIAYSLAGENANELNLITGTRYLNVEGMRQFENIVLSYVNQTDNHVLYRVTPVFNDNNLVASGVEMEAWSVEDSGNGVCFHVYCYNVQPGIVIDYSNGDSHAEEYIDETEAKNTEMIEDPRNQNQHENRARTEPTPEDHGTVIDLGNGTTEGSGGDRSNNKMTTDEEQVFILNTNSHKIHLPECDSVKDMKEKNKKEVMDTLDDLKNQGYVPCKRCLGGF